MSENTPTTGLPNRLRVNPAVVLVAEDPNTIHFRAGPWSGPMSTLRDADGDGELQRLVEFLTGDQRTDAYLESLGDDERRQVVAVLRQLLEKDLLRPQRTDEAPSHADGYLSLHRWGDASTYETLRSKSVLVATTGRIGKMVVEDLVEYGIEDVRELDILGESATDDGVETVPIGDLNDALREVDLLVYAGDRSYPDLLERLNRQALEAETEWISGQLLGFDGVVGPLVYPGQTACYNCFKERLYASIADRGGYRSIERARGQSGVGQLPNFARVIAGLLVTEVVTFLGTGTGFTGGRVVHYDFQDLSVETNDVLKLPRCEDCGVSPVVDATQSVTSTKRVVEDVVLETDE